MTELHYFEYSKVIPLFQNFDQERARIYSLIEGKQHGRVFVDSKDSPSTALLIHNGGSILLGGRPKFEALEIIIENINNMDSEFDKDFLMLFYTAQSWEKIIKNSASKYLRKTYKSTFEYDGKNIKNNTKSKEKLQDRYSIRNIDIPIFKRIVNEFNSPILRYWSSSENFTKNAFGICIFANNEIASVCYTAFVGNGEAPLQINTDPIFRRQGLAYIVCNALIEICIAHNLKPSWSCDSKNLASISLAESLGFKKLNNSPIYIYKKPLIQRILNKL